MAKNVTTMTTNCRLTNNCSHHPTFQHYHVTQRLVVHNSVGNKTKCIRLRPKPRPVWDRSCH